MYTAVLKDLNNLPLNS